MIATPGTENTLTARYLLHPQVIDELLSFETQRAPAPIRRSNLVTAAARSGDVRPTDTR